MLHDLCARWMTHPLQLCRGPPSHPDQARGRRILAPPSREALLPPTGFDWAAAAAAAADVPAELELEHVHGYESVRNAAPNVLFACGGRRVVHYAACLGISTQLPEPPAVQLRTGMSLLALGNGMRTVAPLLGLPTTNGPRKNIPPPPPGFERNSKHPFHALATRKMHVVI